MDHLPIAEISPDLSERQTKQIQAIVTLVWPFSSSTRQCALLLAEPDFRLRRRKGQVRVRFTGSSAKSIAKTEVGIGDEVYLSLRGARFVEEDVGITTPGRSIDWELSYAQTLVAEIRRNGSSIAKLELFDAAPTPTPGTPIHREPMVTPLRTSIIPPDINQRWASPAFMKRTRLSGGLSLDAGFDPLSRDSEDGPEKKRRRKSYRDWNVWQYVARTPSPENEEYNGEDDLSGRESPLRPPQIPETPASITSLAPSESSLVPGNNLKGPSDASNQARPPLYCVQEVRTVGAATPKHAHEEIIKTDARDADYYDLYAGPDEVPPDRYAYGGDTESDTEKEPSDQELEHLTHVDFGAAGSEHMKDVDGSIADVPELIPHLDNPEIQHRDIPPIEEPQELLHRPEHTPAAPPTPEDAMPPPALASLQTSFQTPSGSQLLTPVGQQPRSPVIMPLDSSTLPMPSPFPGDNEGRNLASYFGFSPASHVPDRESASVQLESNDAQQREHERESIVESSFWSSTNSNSKRPHQSEFTDVRFTFGLDGAAFSSPKDLSLSPEPQEQIVLTSQKSPESVDHDEHQEELAEEVADELAMETFEGLRNELPEDLTDTENEELEHELREEFREEFVDDFAADLEAEWPYSDQEPHPPFSEAQPGASPSNEAIKSPERVTGGIPLGQDQPEAHRHDARPHSDVVMISSDRESSVSEDELENKHGGDHNEVGAVEQAVVSLDGSEREVSIMDEKPFEEATGPMAHGASVSEPDRVSPPEPATEIVDMGSPTESEASDDEISEYDIGNAENKTSESVLRHAAQAEHSATSTVTQGEASQAVDIGIPAFEDDVARGFSDVESQPARDRTAQDISMQGPQTPTPTQEPYSSQPDIKVETIEETTAQFQDSASLHEDAQSLASASEQLVIAVPEGHKMGELHYKSVPATCPARNTRSRTKQSTSPAKDDVVSNQSESRSRRSKMSSVSSVMKPPSQSTPSPSRETKSTSPYYTRSQSKLLSPTKPIGTERRSPRKKREYKKEPSRSSSPVSESASHSSSFRNEYVELPDSIFQPSQELGTLQGKFRNVRSVKDSEEGSLHSENSLSTVLMSDDHEGYGAPADFTYSDALQPSTGQSGHGGATPKAITAQPAYSGSGAIANEDAQSSPPTSPSPGRLEESRHSDSVQQKSLLSNTMPITPDGTQSQSQDIPRQLQHTLPISPQLTQKTSFGHASFTMKPELPAASQKDSLEGLDSQPAARSQASTPSVRSEDVSDSERETETQLFRSLEPPSIGLSTPISYYTPLRYLAYFLNRSSQFHTSSNPDVLALVISATTPAKRAPRGPRHYGTTLHVSDLSTFPDATTVQVFRPFSSALPVADEGDVILLRAFQVKSLNRKCVLVSGEESGWCVWRWGKPVWGIKKGQAFGAVRAREEVKGPAVEMGEGEWREVERLRGWWFRDVKGRVGTAEGVGEDGTDGDGKEDARVDGADGS